MAYHLKTRIAIAVSMLTLCFLVLLSGLALSYFEKEFRASTFNYISDALSITTDGLSSRAHHALHVLELIRNAMPREVLHDPRKIQAYLDGLRSDQLIFDNGIGVFSVDGRLLAISPRQDDIIGMDFSFRDYIRVTLLNRQPYISAPIKSRQKHGHPIIMLTEPVYDETGEVTAILAGSFDLYGNNFLQTLIHSKIGAEGFYVMLDQQETIIVHPDRQNILRQARDFFPRQQIIEFLLNSSGRIDNVTLDGREYIGAFQHVSPLNWTLVALEPLDVRFQPVRDARMLIFIALGILSLITILMVRVLTGRLTSPLIELTEKVREQVRNEEGPLDLEAGEYEELGDLSASIQTLVSDLSEKRKGLKDQLSFLQNLIDTIPGPIFYKDRDYRYLGCNKAFEKYLGVSRAGLIGKSVFDIAPPDLAKVYHQADVDLWEQGGQQVYETRVKYADDSLHDVIFYKNVFRDADGQPAGMIGTFLDITDRKASERALLSSEKRFRLLVENAGDAFFLHDEDGRVLDVNLQTCKSLGYSRDELLEMRVPQISEDFDIAAIKQLQAEIQTQDIVTIEDHHRRKDGRTFPVEVRLCYTEQDGGLVIALARDISARKRDEAVLQSALHEARTAKEQVDNILRCAADGLVVTNRRNRVTHINQIAEKMLNVRAEEVIGRPFTKLFTSAELRQQARPFLKQDGRETQQVDIKLNLSGSRFPKIIEARSSILQTETGERSGVVTLLRDVSRERELDQIKSEFISTAAHEMRTPMSVIMGYIEMLLDEGPFGQFPAEQKQQFLREVYYKGESLSRIIDDLFDISRIEAGLPLPIEKSRCDLGKLIHNVVQHYAQHSRKHSFVIQCDDNLIIRADSSKLAQVFENLISNAVKYSPRGGQVNLHAKHRGEMIEIVVADQGVGMTSDQVDRVFDKFYRVDSSDTAISGLGLGMSIVKTIIEAHGGAIRIESAPGQGTRVTVELPARISEGGGRPPAGRMD